MEFQKKISRSGYMVSKCKIILILLSVTLIVMYSIVVNATEEDHTIPWCQGLGGKFKRTDVRLSDGTYPDCVTDKYIIEVDWAHKWYEGIGQSLHYARMDGERKPMLALILKKPSDQKYIERAKALGNYVCPKIKVVVIE